MTSNTKISATSNSSGIASIPKTTPAPTSPPVTGDMPADALDEPSCLLPARALSPPEFDEAKRTMSLSHPHKPDKTPRCFPQPPLRSSIHDTRQSAGASSLRGDFPAADTAGEEAGSPLDLEKAPHVMSSASGSANMQPPSRFSGSQQLPSPGSAKRGSNGKQPAGQEGKGPYKGKEPQASSSAGNGASSDDDLFECVRLSPYKRNAPSTDLSEILLNDGIQEMIISRDSPLFTQHPIWKVSKVATSMGFPLLLYPVDATRKPDGSLILSRDAPINESANSLIAVMDTTSSAFGRPDVSGHGQEWRGDVILIRPDLNELSGAHVKIMLAAIDAAMARATPNPTHRQIDNLFTPRRLYETWMRMHAEGLRRGILGWNNLEGPVEATAIVDDDAVRAGGVLAELTDTLRARGVHFGPRSGNGNTITASTDLMLRLRSTRSRR